MHSPVARLRLVHAPTPIHKSARLSDRLGIDLWIKRDDATLGAEAGNKVRKLEFLLADARLHKTDTVITCGGLQSNHARATALLAASLDMNCLLYLWSRDVGSGIPLAGNAFLCKLAGADVRLITLEQYANRTAMMEDAARVLSERGKNAYVIPEGGSNGLGALGYVEAMRETRLQLDLGLGGTRPFDLIVHACGSGGTTAGVALGAAMHRVATEVRPVLVCNDVAYFQERVGQIMRDARMRDRTLGEPAPITFDDHAKGPSYGKSSESQRKFLVEVARLTGLVLDPVYTGKAMAGLAEAIKNDTTLVGKRVLFLHTGGLPGLLSEGEEFVNDL